ncbi:MAG: nucleoside hydrolase, partial [Bacteroidota bacterium]
MKTYLFYILLIILIYSPTQHYAGEPSKNPVIIDTDCAPDDFRAINYFFSDREIEILAITSEDGVLEPEEGYLKITALLRDLGHEGIPASQGIITKNEAPDWRNIAKSVQWGKPLVSYSQPPEIKEFLVQTITDEERPVDIICMGPLTNIANAIVMEPSIKKQINRIIWFDQCQPGNKWTNYGMDCLSGDYLLGTQVPIYRIKAGDEAVNFDKTLLEEIGKIKSPSAQKIYQTHSADSLIDRIEKKHLKIWDDLTAIFYFYPELFQIDKNPEDTLGSIVQLKEKDMLHDKILETLNKYNKSTRTVLKAVPVDSSYYQEDLAPHIDEIIQRHGIQEWEA